MNENIFVWYVIRIIRKESREKRERENRFMMKLSILVVCSFGDVKEKYVWQTTTSQHTQSK